MLAAGAGVMIVTVGLKLFAPVEEPTSQPASQPATKPVPTTQPATAGADKDADTRDWKPIQADTNTNDQYIGSLDPESGYMFQVQFNSAGAAIHTVKLSKYYASVYDKRRVDDVGWAKYRQALAEGDPQLQGAYSVLNPVSHKGATYYPLATRNIDVTIPGQKGKHPWRHDPQLKSGRAKRRGKWRNWKVYTPPTPETLPDGVQRKSFYWEYSFTPDPAKAAPKPVMRVIKTYEVHKDDYTIYVKMKIENLWGDKKNPLEIDLDQAGPTGLPMEATRDDNRRIIWGKLNTQDKAIKISAEARESDVKKVELGSRETVGRSDDSGQADDEGDPVYPVAWIGQSNKFFGGLLYLVPSHEYTRDAEEAPSDEDTLVAKKLKAEFYYQYAKETATSATQMTGVTIPLKVASGPGKAKTVKFELFVGPKVIDMFDDADAKYYKSRYKTLGYEGTLDLRSCFLAPDWLSLRVVWFLGLLASYVAFDNYGVAIFILVVIVRLLLHPLTKKGQVMMSKMKKVGPMMKELEKKYADDKEALAREKMKMFKQQGASPLLGCLPMLLQMPILIALWSGINASIDLRHAAFLPAWIIDLAAPDRLFFHGVDIPWFGEWLNLLPLLLGGAMYWQMKYSPQAQTATTPEQESQQKMMKFMMPLMMPFMFYNMPSGLTLYFLASTFFGACEQSYIRKAIEAKEALEAATTTTVQMPGRGPRGARPKKSKGPMRFKKG